MKKNKNRIISSIIIIFIILNVYYSVLADENITNENKLNENSTENRTLTLQEQQNQVKENLNNCTYEGGCSTQSDTSFFRANNETRNRKKRLMAVLAQSHAPFLSIM